MRILYLGLLLGLVLSSCALCGQEAKPGDGKYGDPYSSGWHITGGTGELQVSIPIGQVPGEIPIPVAFAMNGSATEHVREANEDGDNGQTLNCSNVFGTVGFGYINSVWESGKKPGSRIILEDGRTYYSSDLYDNGSATPGTGLAMAYGFSGNHYGVSSDGSIIRLTYGPKDLPSAISGQIIQPVGFPAASLMEGDLKGGGYVVVIDKLLARVYMVVGGQLNTIALPVLWKDRFGHIVQFQWFQNTSGLPSSFISITKVIARNQRQKGVVIRIAQSSFQNRLVSDLIRVDFENLSLPSMIANGLSQGALAFLPYDVKVGPSNVLDQPSWNNLPGIEASVGPEVRHSSGEGVKLWEFKYQAAESNVYYCLNGRLLIESITTPSKIKTTFEYKPVALYGDNLNFTHRALFGVTKATQVDESGKSEGVHTYTWERITPTPPGRSPQQTEWKVTAKEWWNSMDATDSDCKWVLNFATIYNNVDAYQSGFQTNSVLLDNDNITWERTQSTPISGGHNGHYTMLGSREVSRMGEIPFMETFGHSKDCFGLPVTSILKMFPTNSAVKTIKQDFSYPDTASVIKMLAFDQPSQVTTTIGSLTPTTVFNDLDTEKLQIKKTYLSAGASFQHGTCFSYDDDGRKISTSTWHLENSATPTPSPKVITYAYDASTGYQSRIVTSYFTESRSHFANLAKIEQVFNDYDNEGRAISVTGEDGVTRAYAYDIYGRLVSAKTPGIRDVVIAYDDEWTITNSQGSKKTVTHLDGFGRKISEDLPDGTTLTYEYDLHGRPAKVKKTSNDEPSKILTCSTLYDLLGRTKSITSYDGVRVDYTYSIDGEGNRVISKAFSDKSCPESTFVDPMGQIVKVIAPTGDVTTRLYNNLGKVTRITLKNTSGTTQTRDFGYDLLGRLVQKVEPETGTQNFSDFDALGQPSSIQEGKRFKRITWDGLGRKRVVFNAVDGVTMTRTFNYEGTRLVSSANNLMGNSQGSVSQDYVYYPVGEGGFLKEETTTMSEMKMRTSYQYSDVGEISAITYPSGREIIYGFDRLDRVNSVKSVLNGITTVIVSDATFDPWGNRKTLDFQSGSQDQWVIDQVRNRIESRKIAPKTGSMVQWDYSYETYTGRMNSTGEWDFKNDSMGRLMDAVKQRWSFGQGADGITINGENRISATYAFDAFGNNVSSKCSTLAGALQNSLNDFLISVPVSTNRLPNSATPNGAINAIYSGLQTGEMIGVNTMVGSATALSMDWDPLGCLASVTQSPGGSTEIYRYAPSGLRVSRFDNLDKNLDRFYGYTTDGLLLSEYGQARVAPVRLAATAATTPISIVQPANGARVAVGVNVKFVGSPATGTSCVWSFGDDNLAYTGQANHAYTEPGVYTVTYAWSGQRASITLTVYDPTGGPGIKSFAGSPSTLLRGQSTRLAWIVQGNFEKLIINPGSILVTNTTSLVVTPACTTAYTLKAYVGATEVFSSSVMITVSPLPPPVWLRDVVYIGNMAIAEIDNVGVHELHSDHLGTPRLITNGVSGAVEGVQTYGPFGELLQATGYKALTGYTGHVQTEPNGLIYMRGRFYYPAWHRFLNSDNGEDANQMNQYAYCDGNPMVKTDPSGNQGVSADPPQCLPAMYGFDTGHGIKWWPSTCWPGVPGMIKYYWYWPTGDTDKQEGDADSSQTDVLLTPLDTNYVPVLDQRMKQYNPTDQETYQIIYSQNGANKESQVSVASPGADSVIVPKIPAGAKPELLIHTHGEDGKKISGYLEPSDPDKGLSDRKSAPMLFGNKLGDIFKYTPGDKSGGAGEMFKLNSQRNGWSPFSAKQMETYMVNYLLKEVFGVAK